MILGKSEWSLSPEDYIVGALLVYIDIIQLFLCLLQVLGESNN